MDMSCRQHRVHPPALPKRGHLLILPLNGAKVYSYLCVIGNRMIGVHRPYINHVLQELCEPMMCMLQFTMNWFVIHWLGNSLTWVDVRCNFVLVEEVEVHPKLHVMLGLAAT